MGRSRRNGKQLDYAKLHKRYDEYSFVSARKPAVKLPKITTANGRARAAPPITTWPVAGMHQSVTYYDDINVAIGWNVRAGDAIFLPFAALDVHRKTVWQGLEQQVPGLGDDAEACRHFEQLAGNMRVLLSNTRVTESVGEAAAAIYVLGNHPGYRMTWGCHVHAGTGIDQIWESPNRAGGTDFLIVEAKGPGATVNFSAFVPPGYSQMQEGWVANHLRSMDRNGHAAGMRIVAALGLTFTEAHTNYQGATKTYYGLDTTSRHRGSPSRVFGRVVEARWLSDGRLSYAPGPMLRYFAQ